MRAGCIIPRLPSSQRGQVQELAGEKTPSSPLSSGYATSADDVGMNTATAETELRPLVDFSTLPAGRGRTSVRTLTRWIAEGATVRGRTIRLRAERIGGSWRCSAAWLDEFFDSLTKAATERTNASHEGA